jgi:hypothetical protein
LLARGEIKEHCEGKSKISARKVATLSRTYVSPFPIAYVIAGIAALVIAVTVAAVILKKKSK